MHVIVAIWIYFITTCAVLPQRSSRLESKSETHVGNKCGKTLEFESINCFHDGEPVYKNGKAVAYLGNLQTGCVGWKIKQHDGDKGALYISAGHCEEMGAVVQMWFHLELPCKNVCPKCLKKKDASCCGKIWDQQCAELFRDNCGVTTCDASRVESDYVKGEVDEFSIWEADPKCKFANEAPLIKLDVARPKPKSNIYIIGYPNLMTMKVSLLEPSKSGDMVCSIMNFWTKGVSQRVDYLCDTEEGMSGGPVFSADTNAAIAIHATAAADGCKEGKYGNTGILLSSPAVRKMLDEYKVSYVDGTARKEKPTWGRYLIYFKKMRNRIEASEIRESAFIFLVMVVAALVLISAIGCLCPKEDFEHQYHYIVEDTL